MRTDADPPQGFPPSPNLSPPGRGTINTKRWDDPRSDDDGFRLPICRYRPRGLPKSDETWDAWNAHLGPSKELHAAAYGKKGLKFTWDDYRRRYLAEMKSQAPA